MVADKVELLTRKAGESEATRWESGGEGTYTIESVDDAPQGTSVTLHLKPEDAEDELHDYTSEWKIKSLVKKYSDFIAWPIRMEVERRIQVPLEGSEEGGEETREEVVIDNETLNSMKALWARPKDEVSEEEYKEFYKHIAHAWDDPLEVIAMKAEGTFEYQALLFIPSHAPFDLFNRDAQTGVQLYVKRVFIMGDCDQLMPEYLRFVKGVVDAAGHVAQRIPRDPAAGSADQGDPPPVDQEGALHHQGDCSPNGRGLPHLLDPIRQSPQRGPAVGLRQPGHPAASLLVRLDAQRGGSHHARRVRRAHEGRPGSRSSSPPGSRGSSS